MSDARRVPPKDAERLYRTLPVEHLRELRQAFVLDRTIAREEAAFWRRRYLEELTPRLLTQRFCTVRIRVIDRILRDEP